MAKASISSRLEALRRKSAVIKRCSLCLWCLGMFCIALPPLLYNGLTAKYGKAKVDSSYLFKGSQSKDISAASPPIYRAGLAGNFSCFALFAVSAFYGETTRKQIAKLETTAD